MEQRNSIVIYGGSFNPPHNSHFSIAEQVLNQYEEVEKVIFAPVSDKYPKASLIETKHRYNMLKIIADKNDGFMVSDIDMDGDKSLPTINVLEEMQKKFPDKEIWVLMGSDNLREIHTWDRPEELVSKYKFLVMEREPDIIEKIINENELLKHYQSNFIKINQGIKTNFNSNYIRNQIKNNKSIRYLVPDEVYQYIKENKLYRR